MIEELMRQFPHLDRMMAETLVKAYENGTLEKYEFVEVDRTQVPSHNILRDSIRVEKIIETN